MPLIFQKIKIIAFVLIVILFLIFLLSRGRVYDKSELRYGLTFSPRQAESLGLDWKEAYLSILNDLGVRRLRLSAYWNEIEPKDNEYDWERLDWQIDEAGKAGAEIILALGGRLPRWPECHFPDWTGGLDAEERNQALLEYAEAVIRRYQGKVQIKAWQIENEPFLRNFGECPEPDKNLLDREIALARKLDGRPVVITDSGELSLWVQAARRADIFGTTMYRDTYSQHLKRYIHYPIAPGFFRFKKNIVRLFAHPRKWIVIELQAEPWGPEPFQKLDKKERGRTMDLQKFKDIVEFSAKTGFAEFYLWGVEWWYWEKTANNDEALWEEAKTLFRKEN